jgi:hypothetical protein
VPIAGRLEATPLADVVNVLSMGAQSGVLRVRKGALSDPQHPEGMVAFSEGNVVYAAAPGRRSLGEILLHRKAVEPHQLARAVVLARKTRPPRSLGEVLVEMGALTEPLLKEAILAQIRQALSELASWRAGDYEFQPGTPDRVDQIAVKPAEVLAELDPQVKFVVQEAVRILEARARPGAIQPGTRTDFAPASGATLAKSVHVPGDAQTEAALDGLTASAGKDAGAWRFQVHDVAVVCVQQSSAAAAVAGALEAAGVRIAAATSSEEALARIDERRARGESPALVADGPLGLPVKKTRPEIHWVAISGDAPRDALELYGAGARAVVPAGPFAPAIVRSVMEELRRERERSGVDGAGASRLMEAARGMVQAMRSSLHSASVSLGLLQAVSESVERAVLFSVEEEQLVGLGGFGQSLTGEPLAGLARRARVLLAGGTEIAACARDGAPRRGPALKLGLPDDLMLKMGPPRAGDALLLPVVAGPRPVAVLYADNGSNIEPLPAADALEVLAGQAGLAFEAALLRRQLEEQKS